MGVMKLDPLLNRADELGRLEDAWRRAKTGRPQLAIVWGRRRVGKTFLLSHFVQGKRGLFFAATQQAEGVELGRLNEAVQRDLGDRAGDLTGGSFATWEAALRFLASLAEEAPLVVVLDEVPYLARSTSGFASIVQSVWDHLRQGTKLLLVLTGSAVGTVEKMLGAGGALRGRPSLPMRLDPLDPKQARIFMPRLDPVQFCEAYAACGGYPLLLKSWDQKASTTTNLFRLAFSSGGLLLEDAAAILSEELPEKGGYPKILGAIGRGRTRYSEISGEAGQRVAHPLDVLIRSGFVRKSLPLAAPKGARPTYALNDTYLAFWFRVLFSDCSLIEGGQGHAVLKRTTPRWLSHLRRVFEEMALGHARRLVEAGRLPEDIVLGRWWRTTGENCEVDVLGLRGRRTCLVGEARWQRAPLGTRDLAGLRGKLAFVPQPVAEPIFVLWGRSGATEAAKRSGALAFNVGEMVDDA